jgi:hypothetical protein
MTYVAYTFKNGIIIYITAETEILEKCYVFYHFNLWNCKPGDSCKFLKTIY